MAEALASVVLGVTVLGGRYKVEKILGRGGMGTVYQVVHLHTGERLALKRLSGVNPKDAGIRERFQREMLTPARIGSEHIVRVTDAQVATDQGGAFLVMELLDGCDLHRLLHGEPLSPAETLWILQQVARALDSAHAVGIVHRDLKPANLFLHRRKDGTLIVKILDFGIAKLTLWCGGSEAMATDLTKAGEILGTWQFMAPEQARGQPKRVGPGTDRWALGVLTFLLLTGQNYFQGPDRVSQLWSTELPLPSRIARELGQAFDSWFLRSCAAEPRARWSSTREQVEQLALALAETPSEQPPASLSQRLAKRAPVVVADPVAAAVHSLQTLSLAAPSDVRSDTVVDTRYGKDAAAAHLDRAPIIPLSAQPKRRWAGLLGGALALLAGCLVGLGLLSMNQRQNFEAAPSPVPIAPPLKPQIAPLVRMAAPRPPNPEPTLERAPPLRRPGPGRVSPRESLFLPTDN